MNRLLLKLPIKKVEIDDIVSPTPSKSALRVIKVAIQKSYCEQQTIRKRASEIRNN
jgi:hypothetical protein